jgi:hypothetical protein
MQCVGEWLQPGAAAAKRRSTAAVAAAEAFVSIRELCTGAPSALDLWLQGERVLDVDLVVVVYKARAQSCVGAS